MIQLPPKYSPLSHGPATLEDLLPHIYPDVQPHLSWAAILLPLIAYGGGRLSLDHLLGIDRAHTRLPTSATAA